MVCSVKKTEIIAKDTLLVEFEAKNRPDFLPGQYVQIVLSAGLKHYFSIVNSPREPGFSIATKLRDSPFKKALLALQIRERVEVNGPWGDLLLPGDKSQKLVFIAAGIGITPFISILRFLQEKKEKRGITLLYFNRTREDVVFFDELESLGKQSPNLKINFITTNRKSPESPLLQFLPTGGGGKVGGRGEAGVIYYIAGPPGFVTAGITALGKLGIPLSQIIHESYTGY